MSLQKRLQKLQARNFVGRHEQLDIFRKNVSVAIPEYPFILISGQGGVGKSTLLEQFRTICDECDLPHASTDLPDRTPVAVLDRFAKRLNEGGYTLNEFEGRYQKYLQLEEQIHQEHDKPDTFGQILGRIAGISTVMAGQMTPFTSDAIDVIGANVVQEQVATLSDYLFQKLKRKDDVQLVLDPAAELTPLFIHDLNKIACKWQLALIFDTFEETGEALLPWLMKLFNGRYGEVSEHVNFIFAGRSFDRHDWLLVEPLLARCNLEPFTLEEATSYLKHHRITNSDEIATIYQLSGGLPVHVAMLAISDPTSGGQATRTVVERFLNNVPDSYHRQIALQLAIPRRFNQDVMTDLFPSKVEAEQADDLFLWLIALPFVQNNFEYWIYHTVVRTQIIAYLRTQSPKRFSEAHQQLAEYYYSLAEQAGRFTKDQWQDQTWWLYYVEATYHAVCANPQENLSKVRQEIKEIILDIDSEMMTAWVSALKQASEELAEYEPALQLASLIETGILALKKYKFNNVFQLFDIFDLLPGKPCNLDFKEGVDAQHTPVGWFGYGANYQVGLDTHITYQGYYSGYLKSTTAELHEPGRLVQIIKAENYYGQRVRLSGYAKSEEIRGRGGLWMKIDGKSTTSPSLDDMRDRPIIGTTGWRNYEIILDIPEGSSRIVFGIQLYGSGHLWVTSLALEAVSQDVSLTGRYNRYGPQNLDFKQGVIGDEYLPIGWWRAGSEPQDYIMGVAPSAIYNERASAYIQSRTPNANGSGVLMQSFRADKYIGQRLQMSAYVKSEVVENWAGLWVRVDGPDVKGNSRTLCFDSMANRPIMETTDWQEYQIVLDIPNESVIIAFGILMNGPGKVWVNHFQFECVNQNISCSDFKLEPVNLNFEEKPNRNIPIGWLRAGSRPNDYIIGIDSVVSYKRTSAFLKSKIDMIEGFGTLMQSFQANNYIGQRLRVKAYVKSEAVEDWAGLWMRVDGPEYGKSLSFDNMGNRAIKGTTNWQEYEIVLDVPKESTNIAFGILMSGIGQVWVDHFRFETVGQDVAVTGGSEVPIITYSESIERDPNDALLFYNRAGAYVKLKDYKNAIDDCNEALRLDSNYAEAYAKRGWIYLIQGRLELSVHDYKESIRLNPENTNAFYNLACAYSLQKNLKASLNALRRCLEIGERKYYLKLSNDDPDFDSIRNDPRFHALLIEFSES